MLNDINPILGLIWTSVELFIPYFSSLRIFSTISGGPLAEPN
jgi:hypothetical protein